MDKNFISFPPEYKLYTDRSIAIATFLGGPLAGGYLAADNFKQLGQTDKVRKTWALSIAVTLLIVAALILIPDNPKIPPYILPLLYTALAQVLVQKYQRGALLNHIEEGGQLYSIWRAVWISIVAALAIIALAFLIFYIADRLAP
jgi:4-amino-4-deoxy-L-arabinose transferase-like glycosyltransferase